MILNQNNIDDIFYKIEEVRFYIEEIELDKAFDLFIEICRKSEVYYNFLLPLKGDYKEFKDDKLAGKDVRGKLADIIVRLVHIILEFEKSISVIIDENTNEKPFNKIHELVLDLNFDKQSSYFQKSVEQCKGQLISFLIRGSEREYGQQWLYNRFFRQYSEIHDPVSIKIEGLNANLEDFINSLAKRLIENYDSNEDLRRRKKRLRQSLSNRVETKPQFIIIHDASNFIHSSGFADFYEMLSDFNEEITINEKSIHNCIFLFVENQSAPYTCEHYLCSSLLKPEELKDKDFKIIGLPEIEPINETCFHKWLENKHPDIKSNFNNFENFIEKCNGHPQEIIDFIFEKISKHYQKKCLIC